MNDIESISNQDVKVVFENYPERVQKRMLELRNAVMEAAEELELLDSLEECLKWGEPSYVSKYGSTVRMDWKEKNPEQFAIYFKCTSKLVPSFRNKFEELFQFEGNRAILFGLDEKLPKNELKICIQSALRYHKIKHLDNLGIE